MMCTTVLHGGVCHRTLTPHKSGNKMKEKKMNAVPVIWWRQNMLPIIQFLLALSLSVCAMHTAAVRS